MFASNTSQVSEDANYIESCFSTTLYTGNGSTQTINNGIDLAGEGGIVWTKVRNQTFNHSITYQDSSSTLAYVMPNATNEAYTSWQTDFAYNSNGFSLNNSYGMWNGSGNTYASWTFRKQPKFFDVVTWTGDGVAGRQIAHNLGSAPGAVFIKCTSNARNWRVWHRSLTTAQSMVLNSTAIVSSTNILNSTAPTSTTLTLSADADVNNSGYTYVAYLFAHDAGGFGESGTDNVISCGSYTGNGSTNGPTVTLGYEPQWVLIKNASAASSVGWFMTDNLRGCETNGTDRYLAANLSQAETDTAYIDFTATGFNINSTFADVNGSGNTMIYIAIRRGPMRTPTSGTSVFAPVAYTATNVDNRLVNTGIITDMTMARVRTALSTGGFYTADRLRGNPFFGTAVTNAEDNSDTDSFMTPTAGYGNSFSAMNGFGVGNDSVRQLNYLTADELAYAFRRAPGFFDVVCYTGTGVARTVNHNLGVAPGLMIVKGRSTVSDWTLYLSNLGATKYIEFNTSLPSTATNRWNNTEPSASAFTVGTATQTNANAVPYVAYLFASCPGVSKVGSYTGTGTTQQINCGFTGGARFVLIKRTDSTGDWYVWDSARGIVAGNDPYLLLNSTAAEVTSTDYIDTYSAGFEISSTAPAAINASGGTFIYLAIA